ncbi:uncharacterized protein TNCT_218041 [Trichonephila clavata]|uniref:Tail sheath protein subtilisin-like domain-containing protein n=1 Tax=Trichonephila clavata TaxID=2740835 RepID=A0A8X6GWL7_TRICU|nr:uncharacterized protein TNCT_218041 [Trichonephila clavata]
MGKGFEGRKNPPSPFVAGLIAKVDSEQGFWHSPSNKEINGIVGTSRAIDFTLDGNSVSLTLRGGLQGSGSNDIEGVIINLRGIFREFDFGSWKPAEKATLKCTVAAHYYKLTIGGNELIESMLKNDSQDKWC